MKINVNQDSCIGCGACVAICNDLFDFNEDGLSQAKVETVPEDKKDQAMEAKESCPTEAITIE